MSSKFAIIKITSDGKSETYDGCCSLTDIFCVLAEFMCSPSLTQLHVFDAKTAESIISVARMHGGMWRIVKATSDVLENMAIASVKA